MQKSEIVARLEIIVGACEKRADREYRRYTDSGNLQCYGTNLGYNAAASLMRSLLSDIETDDYLEGIEA